MLKCTHISFTLRRIEEKHTFSFSSTNKIPYYSIILYIMAIRVFHDENLFLLLVCGPNMSAKIVNSNFNFDCKYLIIHSFSFFSALQQTANERSLLRELRTMAFKRTWVATWNQLPAKRSTEEENKNRIIKRQTSQKLNLPCDCQNTSSTHSCKSTHGATENSLISSNSNSESLTDNGMGWKM